MPGATDTIDPPPGPEAPGDLGREPARALARAGAGRVSWEVLDPSREVVPGELRRLWSGLVEASDNPFALYQSPDWFDHLAATGLEGRARLALGRDEDGEVVAIVPHTVDRRRLSLHVARGFRLPTPPISLVKIWGGRPMMPETPGAVDGLVRALTRWYAGSCGIDLFGVCEDSRFLRALEGSASARRRFVLERREGLDQIDLIPLPRSFGEFLAKYDAKKRYNLRRQDRLLREQAGGDLVLERVERPEDVPAFLASVAALGRPGGSESPPTEEARLRDLARRGLLRSYVLRAAGRPIACLMGKQHGRTHLIDWTRHDRAFRAYSPGTTLLHLAIEDLIVDRPGSLINLGYGSPRHDSPSTNLRPRYQSSWLIPRTRACRLVLGLRSILRAGALAVGSARRPWKGREAGEGPGPAYPLGASEFVIA